jgi:hypothetical protein
MGNGIRHSQAHPSDQRPGARRGSESGRSGRTPNNLPEVQNDSVGLHVTGGAHPMDRWTQFCVLRHFTGSPSACCGCFAVNESGSSGTARSDGIPTWPRLGN